MKKNEKLVGILMIPMIIFLFLVVSFLPIHYFEILVKNSNIFFVIFGIISYYLFLIAGLIIFLNDIWNFNKK